MGELTQQATIAASPERVFAFVADPHNAPRYISSIRRVISGPSGPPVVDQAWQVEANFLSRPVNLTLRLVELAPPGLVTFALEGDPQAMITLRLAEGDAPSQSRVSLTLEVPSVPTMLLTAFMGALLAGDMNRLKEALEGNSD